MKIIIAIVICFVVGFSFGSLGAQTGDTFDQAYAMMRQKKPFEEAVVSNLAAIAKQETTSKDDRLLAWVLSVVALSSMDVDDSTRRSIVICDAVIKEVPNSWQADFLRYARLADYGLIADYKEQITLGKAALVEIDFKRFDAEKHDFLDVYRKDFGLSARVLRNEILAMLGYAYRMTQSFEEAKKAYSLIDDEQQRKKNLDQLQIFQERYHRQQEKMKAKKDHTNGVPSAASSQPTSPIR